MSIINNMPSRPGIKIDGIIQSYYVYAGENISAGSFVEFINGVASQVTGGGNPYQIKNNNIYYVNACVIDTNKVFIIYKPQSQSSYAKIINISNNTITQGTEYEIPYSDIANWQCCCAVTSTKVFLAGGYNGNSSSSTLIANISGNTITFVGSGVSFYSSTARAIRCSLWQPDKVLVYFEANSNDYPMAVVMKITNDVITNDSGTSYITSSYYSNNITGCSLGYNKQFVMYYNNKSNTTSGWYAHILNGSGSTLSVVSGTLLSDLPSNSEMCCCTINPNLVLLVSKNYSMLVKINNDLIIYNNNYKYAHNDSTSTNMSFCSLIGTNEAVINFNDAGNSYYPTSVIANIEGNVITYSQKFAYNTTRMYGDMNTRGWPCCLLVDNGKIGLYYLIRDESLYYNYFQVLYASGNTVSKTTRYEKQVRNITQALCDGVSNTAGTGGTSTAHNQAVEVYIPIYNSEEEDIVFDLVVNGNFSDGTNGWTVSYGSIATDPTYGNYLACVWTNTINSMAVSSDKYMSDGRTADKFYMCCNAKGYSTNTGRVCLYCCQETIDITGNNTWGFYSKCFTASSSILNLNNTKVSTVQYSATQTGNKLDITNIRVFNLTQIFGSGNEPDKAWCDEHLGGDIS